MGANSYVDDDSNCKSEEDFTKAAESIKALGNESFKKGEYKAALDKYEKVCEKPWRVFIYL